MDMQKINTMDNLMNVMTKQINIIRQTHVDHILLWSSERLWRNKIKKDEEAITTMSVRLDSFTRGDEGRLQPSMRGRDVGSCNILTDMIFRANMCM